MKIIDAHHHLWDLGAVPYPWLMEEAATSFFGSYAPIAVNYLPEDYLADTANWSIAGSVHIQAECDPAYAVEETAWLSGFDAPIPTAIVAYVDLAGTDAPQMLERQSEYERVRGIRQIVNHHEDAALTYTPRDLLHDERWLNGFLHLRRFGLSFDLQLYYRQMPRAARLAADHPDVQFVLNHTGMPVERDEDGLAGWRSGMAQLSQQPNVAVKLSGLGMTDPNWTTASIRPLVLDTIEAFGIERCLFASNFPVDGLFSDFDTLYNAYSAITADFSAAERQRLFHDNAARIYRLR